MFSRTTGTPYRHRYCGNDRLNRPDPLSVFIYWLHARSPQPCRRCRPSRSRLGLRPVRATAPSGIGPETPRPLRLRPRSGAARPHHRHLPRRIFPPRHPRSARMGAMQLPPLYRSHSTRGRLQLADSPAGQLKRTPGQLRNTHSGTDGKRAYADPTATGAAGCACSPGHRRGTGAACGPGPARHSPIRAVAEKHRARLRISRRRARSQHGISARAPVPPRPERAEWMATAAPAQQRRSRKHLPPRRSWWCSFRWPTGRR